MTLWRQKIENIDCIYNLMSVRVSDCVLYVIIVYVGVFIMRVACS